MSYQQNSARPHFLPRLRLYINTQIWGGSTLTLEKNQSHYLTTVMRKKAGDSVYVFNGSDGEWQTTILEANKRLVTLQVESQLQPQRAEPDLWLAFAPIKHGRIDYLIEKTTELGVATLIPTLTQRTIARNVKIERLQAHALEAAEQCERLSVPHIADAVSLDVLLNNWPEGRTLYLADERGNGAPIVQVLTANKNLCAAFLIGPEGGFTKEELEKLRNLPYVTSVSLGPRILRADTAAISALTCWQSLIGDWS